MLKNSNLNFFAIEDFQKFYKERFYGTKNDTLCLKDQKLSNNKHK